jgi:hypothetical protein
MSANTEVGSSYLNLVGEDTDRGNGIAADYIPFDRIKGGLPSATNKSVHRP